MLDTREIGAVRGGGKDAPFISSESQVGIWLLNEGGEFGFLSEHPCV